MLVKEGNLQGLRFGEGSGQGCTQKKKGISFKNGARERKGESDALWACDDKIIHGLLIECRVAS